MKTPLIAYLVLMNVSGFACMGIDKWKAKHNRWRIPEKTLFLLALLGGSIGIFSGMYFFRHKTRHLKFTIGIPTILVLQVLLLIFTGMWHHDQRPGPSAVVSHELDLIRELDEDTIRSLISYENMATSFGLSSDIGPETTEAVALFFRNFDYHLHSETISGDTAEVTAEITNLDMQALARDLCKDLTAHTISIFPQTKNPQTLNDFFSLLGETLKKNTYGLAVTTAYFHLKKTDGSWVIQADDALQDQLVSNFISWINDENLLTPQEVLTIYLDEFSALDADAWLQYLQTEDIFSTGSEAYAADVDRCYTEKLAECFSYSIDQCDTSGSDCTAQITINSLDMHQVLKTYKEKLVDYAHTSDSITSDEAGLSDASAQYLLEALEENAQAASFPVSVTLHNDGHSWQLELSDAFTNACLGDISGALEAFNSGDAY